MKRAPKQWVIEDPCTTPHLFPPGSCAQASLGDAGATLPPWMLAAGAFVVGYLVGRRRRRA